MIRPRLHTRTLIVLLLIAAAILALNVATRSEWSGCFRSEVDTITYGWPGIFLFHRLPNHTLHPGIHVEWSAFLFNALLWIEILVIAALLVEMVARRSVSFQIHLNTALLLMLASAVILSLNLLPTRVTTDVPFTEGRHTYAARHFGWPQTVYVDHSDGDSLGVKTASASSPPWYSRDNRDSLVTNASVAIGILSIIALISEFLLRRVRKKRIADPTP